MYSYFFTDYSQGYIYDQFATYLNKISIVENSQREFFIDECGDCNGWAFLCAYHYNTHTEQEYFDTLEYISNWDGKISTLEHNYGMSDLLKSKYENGIKLFEQTINNVAWFSHTKAADATHSSYQQTDRVEQWEMVKVNGIELDPVFKFIGIETPINKVLLPDMLEIASHWTDTWLDIGVYNFFCGHALSVYITAEGKFVFYDCNNYSKPFETVSTYEVAEYIAQALGGNNASVYDFASFKFHPDTDSAFDINNLKALPDTININAVEKYLNLALSVDNLDVFHAVYKMYESNVEKLNPNLANKALVAAAYEDKVELISLLLEKGTNVDHTDTTGKSALMIAAQQGNEKLVTLLLANNADLNIEDFQSNTALSLANQHNHQAVAALLENAALNNAMENLQVNESKPITIGDCISLNNDNIIGLEDDRSAGITEMQFNAAADSVEAINCNIDIYTIDLIAANESLISVF